MDVERLPGGVQDKMEASSADDKNCNAINTTGIVSPADLVRLLSCLESELQARDLFIVGLMKSQASKQLLYQAKYGRLGLNDPFASLQRDSETCGEPDSAFDEVSVGKMYETQLGQLEKLIAVQRRAHLRAKQVLAAAEKRHARTVREWEEERQRRKFEAAQSDDVCMMLEKERERLKGELEVEKGEQERLKAELARLNRLINEEKERRKQIVLCLLQDRRKLAILFSEERTKVQALTKKIDKSDQCKNCSANKNGSEEALKRLTLELENVKSLLKQEKEENASLKETLRCQESDLNLIRETILAKSKKINLKSANSAICNNSESMSCSEISGRSHDVKYSTNTISHRSQQPVHHDAATRKTSLPSPQNTPSVSPLLRYRPPMVNNTSSQQQRFPSPKFQSVPPPQKSFQNVVPPSINEQLLIASPKRSQSVRASLGPKLKSSTAAESGHHPPMYPTNAGQTAGIALIGPGNLSASQKVPASPSYPQQNCFPQSPFLEAIRGLFGQTTNIVTGIQSSLVDRLSNSTTELCVENNAALVRESEFSASGALDIGAAINEFDLNVNGQPVPSAIPRFPHGLPNYVTLNHQPQNEPFSTKAVNNQQQQCLVRPLCLKANLIGPKSHQIGSLPLSTAVAANSQLTKSLTACSSSMTSTAPSCRWQYNKQRQATTCNKPAGGVGLTVAGLANKVQQKVGHHLRQRSFDRSSSSTESTCRSTRSTRVRFNEEMQSPRYTVEHLATFGYGPNFGLNNLSDGIRKLKHMELTHAIWAQRMVLRLKRDAVVIEDENMEIVEAFPLNLVSEVTAYLSGDSSSSHDIYNNLLVFIVNENNAANNNNKTASKTQPALVLSEMHIFQCVRISAEEVAEDVRQYVQGRFSNVPWYLSSIQLWVTMSE